MEEQEILSVLKARVARYQSAASNNPVSKGNDINPFRIEMLSAEVWNARNAVGQLNPRNPGLPNQAIQAFKKIMQRSLGWYTRSLQGFHGSVANAIEEHGRAINSFQRALLASQESVRTVELATQEQQVPYVRLFRGLSSVLDIGCGRGEFLELLREAGICAYGVDSDRMVCDAARRKNLNVIEGDLFDHLRQLPDRSLDGIFAARVIEYLAPHLHPELVRLCANALRPNGVIVIETINPDSDFPFGRNSRLDPTHLRPLYPEVLRAILDSHGFEESRICILAPHVVPVTTAAEQFVLASDENGVDMSPVARMQDAQAYAAIARRG